MSAPVPGPRRPVPGGRPPSSGNDAVVGSDGRISFTQQGWDDFHSMTRKRDQRIKNLEEEVDNLKGSLEEAAKRTLHDQELVARFRVMELRAAPLPADLLAQADKAIEPNWAHLTPEQFAAHVEKLEKNPRLDKEPIAVLRALVASRTVTKTLELWSQTPHDTVASMNRYEVYTGRVEKLAQGRHDTIVILNALGCPDALGPSNSYWFLQAIEAAL